MTARALDAARLPNADGVTPACCTCRRSSLSTRPALLEFASRHDRLVVAENHKTTGGLATLVIEALYDAGVQRPLIRIGLDDSFFECGSQEYLEAKYGVDLPRVVHALVDGT